MRTLYWLILGLSVWMLASVTFYDTVAERLLAKSDALCEAGHEYKSFAIAVLCAFLLCPAMALAQALERMGLLESEDKHDGHDLR